MEEPGSHLKALDGGRKTRRLTTILVADICGYSRMSEKDQDAAIRTADLLFKLFEDVTARHGGRVFKRIADGFLAEYPSARSGMQAALDYAKEVKARNSLAPNAINADIRAGIHVGDVTDRPDGDILGHGVNVAARLQELADPGTVLASSNIMNLTRKDIPFKINKRTGLALKNIDEPMTAFQIDPEKSGGSFDIQIPKIFKSKALLYTALAGVVMYGAMEFQGQRAEAKLEGRITAIIEENFKEKMSAKSGVSQEYIDEVLRKLYYSDIPTHRASFALVEQGNIAAAIDMLDRSLNDDLPKDTYIDTLHIIGALSFNFDPIRARSVYQTILKAHPKDKSALFWLLRNGIIMANPDDVVDFYNRLVESQELSDIEAVSMQTDMAFSLMIKGEFQAGLDLLEPLEGRLTRIGDERLLLKWQINKAIALERLDKLEDSEELLDFVISKLEFIGADGNMTRAFNVKGLIAEKKAEKTPGFQEQLLKEALSYYEKQYEVGELIGKKRELAESLHYMGRIHLRLDNPEQALKDFLNSYRIARQIDNHASEFKSLLGLAQVDHFNGEFKKACKHIREAEEVFEKKMGPNLGPTSRKILKELECRFKPIEL